MNWKTLFKTVSNETFYNYFFYYYLHLRHSRWPKRLNLKCPTTFNEKTIWLKLNHRYPNAHVYVDKILAKEIVRDAVGAQYVIPTIAVYENADQIDFSRLPEAFVLKANHGSGWNIVCPNKASLNIAMARRKLNEWLRTNYYSIGKEYQYRDVKPKILCETYLANTPENPLVDYKIFCFSGQPLFIQVDIDRFTNHSRRFYDLAWNPLPFTTLYPIAVKNVVRPKALDEMRKIAGRLAEGFVFSRIDLYYHGNTVYFGEITFHHGGGFEPFTPREYDAICGQHIVLPV